MTLLFFPKGLEKKAAIAVDLLKPYFPGNCIETAFLSRQAISTGKKQRMVALLLANRFLTHNGLVSAKIRRQEKFIGTYLQKE